MRKVVVELSGGADSMVAALEAKKKYPDAEIHGFFVAYHQAPVEIEWQKALEFANAEGILMKRILIEGLFVKGTVEGEESADTDGVAQIYTPLRNLVIGACAASWAENIGADVIISGSKGLNDDGKPYSFRDSLLPFYTLLNAVTQYAAYKPITVDPILTNLRNNKMTKKEVYEYLLDAGYGWDSFWNCFNGGPEPCGECNNCVELNILKSEIENDK